MPKCALMSKTGRQTGVMINLVQHAVSCRSAGRDKQGQNINFSFAQSIALRKQQYGRVHILGEMCMELERTRVKLVFCVRATCLCACYTQICVRAHKKRRVKSSILFAQYNCHIYTRVRSSSTPISLHTRTRPYWCFRDYMDWQKKISILVLFVTPGTKRHLRCCTSYATTPASFLVDEKITPAVMPLIVNLIRGV